MFFENFSVSVLVVVIILLMALAALVAKRRMFKIDHTAPEHRAKENELYEAFGLDTPRDESMPEDHEKKEKEVVEAFQHLKAKHKHTKRS